MSDNKYFSAVLSTAGLATLAVLIVFAYFAFINLDYAPFWDDEAALAWLARNWIEFGLPLADDGRNVFTFNRGGTDIADDLTLQYPPLVTWLEAQVFVLFGAGETQARMLSALLSLAAMLLFADVLRREFSSVGSAGFVVLALVFACFMPLTLAYARSATYNAAVLLLHVLMFWSYLRFCERPRGLHIGFAALAVLAAIGAFHAHYLANVVFVAALVVFHLLFRRHQFDRRAWIIAVVVAAPYLLQVLWYYFTEYSFEAYGTQPETFSLAVAARLLGKHLAMLNHNGIVYWSVALWFVLWHVRSLLARPRSHRPAAGKQKHRRARQRAHAPEHSPAKTSPWQTLREDRVFQYFIFVLLGAVFLAALTSNNSQQPWMDVRYFSSFAPFAAPLAAVAVWRAWRLTPVVGVVVGAALLLSNVAGWPFLKHRLHGTEPGWTLPAQMLEYHRDYPGPMRAALDYLREHAKPGDIAYSTLANQLRLLYYVDQMSVCCVLSRKITPPEALPTAGREHLFREDVLSGGANAINPDWLLFFGNAPASDTAVLRKGGPSYKLAVQIPGVFLAPATLQRPEPVWHDSFPPQDMGPNSARNSVRIYKIR